MTWSQPAVASGQSNAVTVCGIKTRSHDVITEQIPEGQIGLQSNSQYKPLWCVNNVSTWSNNTWRNPEHVHQITLWPTSVLFQWNLSWWVIAVASFPLMRFKSFLSPTACAAHPSFSLLFILNKSLLLMPARQKRLPVCWGHFPGEDWLRLLSSARLKDSSADLKCIESLSLD